MGFCSKLKGKVKDLVKKIEPLLPDAAQILAFTKGLQAIIDSWTVKSIVDVTPNTWDNEFRSRVSAALVWAVKALNISTTVSEQQALNDFLSYLRTKDKHQRNAMLFKLAALILKYLNNFKHRQNVYDSAIQTQYTIDAN